MKRFRGIWIPFILLIIAAPIQASDRKIQDMPLPHPSQRYPVKNNSVSIRNAFTQPVDWAGKAVSFEATVRATKINSRGQPYIQFALGDADDTTLWGTWAIVQDRATSDFLSAGDKLRVFGWLQETRIWSQAIREDLPWQDSVTLLPACLVKVRNSDAIFDRKFGEYCEGWQKGFWPPDMAAR